ARWPHPDQQRHPHRGARCGQHDLLVGRRHRRRFTTGPRVRRDLAQVGNVLPRPGITRRETGMKAHGYVFLNGRIIEAARATVSVYDRGLLYGDGLFETMRAYKGIAFAIEDHFHRMRTSADILGLPIPNLDWPAIITELLDKNGLANQDAWVRLTITRGPAEPRVIPPDLAKPTSILMVRPLDREIATHQKQGVKI